MTAGGHQGSGLASRRLDRLDAAPLAGLDNASSPVVSPDNRWIAFVESASTLKKVASAARGERVDSSVAHRHRGATIPAGDLEGRTDEIGLVAFARGELGTV